MKNAVLMIAAILFYSAPSFSQTSETSTEGTYVNMKRPHFGITAGLSTPEGSFDSAAELGVNFGYQPVVPFGIGASIATVRNSASDGGQDLERTNVLARATYNLGPETPMFRHAWFGLALGMAVADDGTYAALAPVAGFDFPIQRYSTSFLSLGAEAQYLIVDDQNDNFALSGALKYWY